MAKSAAPAPNPAPRPRAAVRQVAGTVSATRPSTRNVVGAASMRRHGAMPDRGDRRHCSGQHDGSGCQSTTYPDARSHITGIDSGRRTWRLILGPANRRGRQPRQPSVIDLHCSLTSSPHFSGDQRRKLLRPLDRAGGIDQHGSRCPEVYFAEKTRNLLGNGVRVSPRAARQRLRRSRSPPTAQRSPPPVLPAVHSMPA